VWESVYASDWQGVWAVLPVPLLFAVWLAIRGPRAGGAAPAATGFVHGWALVFALETALDPVATGLLPRTLGFADTRLATLVLIAFVLLGDFRVFLLAERVAAPDASLGGVVGAAAAWTLVVPMVALVAHATLLAATGALPSTAIWVIYEIVFVGMALFRRARVRAPADGAAGYLRAVWTYVLLYYALWAAADLAVLAGVDAGWALRIVPNQLYYALFVPVAWTLFFSPRYAATSTSTQASR